jgi:predicted DCC family thiol-disulfide oxidoreductase YuxK
MVEAATSRSPDMPRGTHLILYDGVCGLCNGAVQFVLAHDGRRVFDFASLQSATGRAMVSRFGRSPEELDTFCVVTDYRSHPALAIKSTAALSVTKLLGRPWQWLTILRIIPVSLRDRIYDLVAKHRYRVFGRYDTCRIPDPAERARFIDV